MTAVLANVPWKFSQCPHCTDGYRKHRCGSVLHEVECSTCRGFAYVRHAQRPGDVRPVRNGRKAL